MKPCGTTAAYQRHHRNRETPCLACVLANRTARRDWYRARHGHRLTTATQILSQVDTLGALTILELSAMIPGVSYATIRRTVYRMFTDGRLARDTDILINT